MVGAPGSGKSSLIAALLGEMTCLAGMISWKPLVTLCRHNVYTLMRAVKVHITVIDNALISDLL